MNNAGTLPINIFCSVVLVTGLTVPNIATGALATFRLSAQSLRKILPATFSVKEEGNMVYERFSANEVQPEASSPISLLTIYEEGTQIAPRNDGALSLSRGFNVGTDDGGASGPDIKPKLTIVDASGEKQKLTSNDNSSINDGASDPRGAVRDEFGNLSRFKIGPESEEAEVSIKYADAAAKPPTISNTTIKRADGEVIDYVRERDPSDPNSPFIYTEARNGSRGDLLYGSFDVAADGRLTLYFDFERKRPAITFNPKTGYEEYP